VANIGTGIGTSVNKIAKLLMQKINPGIGLKYAAPRQEEPANSVASIIKAKITIGFKARYCLEDKIDEVIDYIKNQ